jgi:hypothetical protein
MFTAIPPALFLPSLECTLRPRALPRMWPPRSAAIDHAARAPAIGYPHGVSAGGRIADVSGRRASRISAPPRTPPFIHFSTDNPLGNSQGAGNGIQVMDAEEAMGWVRDHGIVLLSAKGPVPRLTEVIAGEPIKGSWWAHPKSHEIFRVLQELGESPDILMCRLVNGYVTLIHRRMWPPLIRLADRYDHGRLAQISQVHTPSGRHESREVPYPKWVPAEVLEQAKLLTADQATMLLGSLGHCCTASY